MNAASAALARFVRVSISPWYDFSSVPKPVSFSSSGSFLKPVSIITTSYKALSTTDLSCKQQMAVSPAQTFCRLSKSFTGRGTRFLSIGNLQSEILPAFALRVQVNSCRVKCIGSVAFSLKVASLMLFSMLSPTAELAGWGHRTEPVLSCQAGACDDCSGHVAGCCVWLS